MDTAKLQKLKLLNLLKSVLSLINLYTEKHVLEDEISISDYNKLEDSINEFIDKHLRI